MRNGTVPRLWLAGGAILALMVGVLAAAAILADRAAVLRQTEERTRTMARLLTAHAETALEGASAVLAAVEPAVARWNLVEPVQGRAIFEQLRRMVPGTAEIPAAWILDGTGMNRLDSRTYPASPIDASARPYFEAHRAGAEDPVILGDPRPGSVTGQERFTFSRALRNADGTVRAVLVVAVSSGYFRALYEEAATWPGARAALYTRDGSLLARLEPQPGVTPEFLAAIRASAATAPRGSRTLRDGAGWRIASWQRSERYAGLYGSSSQPVDLAVADWRERSLWIALTTVLAIGSLVGAAFHAARAARTRQQADLNGLLVREVHHRVKNSLQLVHALVAMRARQSPDPASRASLEDLASQVVAISRVHEELQGASSLDEVDLCALLHSLCESLARGYRHQVAFAGAGRVGVDAAQATSVSIVVNELVTNALKHAATRVDVTCGTGGGQIHVTVRDDGPGLPPGFDIGRTAGRFGLRTAALLAGQLGGDLKPVPSDRGATFRLSLPLADPVRADGASPASPAREVSPAASLP